MSEKTGKRHDVPAVILIGAFVLLAVTLCFLTRPEGTKQKESLTFVLRVTGVEGDMAEHLHVGDRLLDKGGGRTLGTVREVRMCRSKQTVYSEKAGKLISSEVPDLWDMDITVTAEGTRRGGVKVGGRPISVGDDILFLSWDFAGTGRVAVIR